MENIKEKELTTNTEQPESITIIQNGSQSIIINDEGITINSESGKLRFLNL